MYEGADVFQPSHSNFMCMFSMKKKRKLPQGKNWFIGKNIVPHYTQQHTVGITHIHTLIPAPNNLLILVTITKQLQNRSQT